MRVRGPHGVAVDAFGGDLIAASAFNGVIQANDDAISGNAHGHQEPEEQPTRCERRPDSAMQDTRICLKVGRRTASHNPQHRRHCPLPRRKDAPVMRTFTCCHTGLEKTGAKTPMTLVKVIGKESMAILSV